MAVKTHISDCCTFNVLAVAANKMRWTNVSNIGELMHAFAEASASDVSVPQISSKVRHTKATVVLHSNAGPGTGVDSKLQSFTPHGAPVAP